MTNHRDRILFLLRQGQTSSGYTPEGKVKAGLFVSASMTLQQLQDNFCIDGMIRVCFDSNQIDKEVFEYKPKFVIIEALWVPPYKFRELVKLHPHVHFIVRVHSELPFLANEGIAFDYIKGYVGIPKVHITFNSKHTAEVVGRVVSDTHTFYLPNIYEDVNYYPTTMFEGTKLEIKYSLDKGNHLELRRNTLDIGCFGAIRPMKNQLMQAASAIAFGEKTKKRINFHINAGRVEQQGENVLKNIRALFKDTDHNLIEHGWLERSYFLDLLSNMDLSMQLSLNESFNIVAADSISKSVPTIVSNTIEWMPGITKTSTENYHDIVRTMIKALNNKRYFLLKSRESLVRYNHNAIRQWGNTLF